MICAVCGVETTSIPCGSCALEPRVDRRYALTRRVRALPYGVVWDAVDGEERVELVEVARMADLDATNWSRVVAQLEALRRVAHPMVPTILDVVVSGFEPSRSVWIARAPCEGATLDRLSTEEGLELLTDLLDLLKVLHGLTPPLLLGELRPDMLRRGPTGGFQLVELPLVRPDQRIVQPGTDGPTLCSAWSAPEVAGSIPTVGADLYGAALVVAGAWTGKDPTRMRDVKGNVRWRGEHPVEGPAAALIDSLLCPRPLGRPANAADALNALTTAVPALAPRVGKGKVAKAELTEEEERLLAPAERLAFGPTPEEEEGSTLWRLVRPISVAVAVVCGVAIVGAASIGTTGAQTAGPVQPVTEQDRVLFRQVETSVRLRHCAEEWRVMHPLAPHDQPGLTVAVLWDGSLKGIADPSLPGDLYQDQAQCVTDALGSLPGAGGTVEAGAQRLIRMRVGLGKHGNTVVDARWAYGG